jgi:hypothetical protein
MKKWILYLAILAAIPVMSYGGFGGEDVGKLYPVQTVMISPEKEGVRILTDGGQLGLGKNIEGAMKNLHNTANVRIFLDTADYLLLEPGMEMWLPQLKQYLRPSCCVCHVSVSVDPAEATAYLQLHQPNLSLTQYEAGERKLPTLIYDDGRMTLVRS